MTDDPTPLRFRTYPWFPVLTVGTVLLLTWLAAAGVEAGELDLPLLFSLAGLYVSAVIGVHGLLRDAAALAAAGADWRPSRRRYILLVALVAAGLTGVTVAPPVPRGAVPSLGPVGVVGAAVVSLALATGPVCGAYLLARWRRVGLNYL
ncbi:MAG: hypothetical protein ABEJ61_08770 [Haloferacaceae archaeon]